VVPGASVLDVEEEEDVRRYSVELIIFEYVDRANSGTEIFDPEELPVRPEEEFMFGDAAFGLPNDVDQFGSAASRITGPLDIDPAVIEEASPADELFDDDTDVLLPPEKEIELVEIPTYEQAGLKLLGPEDYVLNNTYQRLQTLDAYRPLMHMAWTQPTLEKDATVPITLRRLGDPPLRLDGTMTLYLGRFLHLVVDLELEEKASRRIQTSNRRLRRFGDERSRFGFNSEFETASIIYRIGEDRIVRNGELRYYDHPRFGVLAKVSRVEEEEPADADIDTFASPISDSNQN